ncbi:MAG: hypothetical protein HQL29_02705 [Candidatus Omnitrophica bacterium]|nr:hypothetical protein [Candidatus Omnitrophota bacterium]
MNPEYFEAIMLVCFGVAWPVSIYKLLKTKTSEGKSIPFVGIVLLGYFSGICFQWFGERDIVILLYFSNTLMVAVDLFLTIKYKKRKETV